jgi:hypothetical protein
MATVTAIKERTQNKVAMNKVISYVSQDKKTLFQSETGIHKLISGKDCCAETAYSEFMATKRQYGKDNGVFFYQYVQSFKPGENITPQQVHQIGLELSKQFEGHEVLVATHIDTDHWHNHFIVNSVSHTSGKKLQFNEKDLNKLRQKSDEICSLHGLSILKPYEKQEKKHSLSQREYRAALRGNSWKFALMAAIDKAMALSHSKAEFTACMKQQGYEVKWEPHYKYITYITPKGQKCRDNRLHEDKYLKANMEDYYAKLGRTQKDEWSAHDLERTIRPDSLRHSKGAMGSNAELTDRHGKQTFGTQSLLGEDTERENERPVRQPARELDEALPFRTSGYKGANHRSVPGDNRYDEELDWGDDGYADIENDGYTEEYGKHAPSSGHVAAETQNQVDRNRGIDLSDILHLAKTVEDLMNPYDPRQEKQKKEYAPKGGRKNRKKQQHNINYDLSM